jgi:rod shape-determining protein MreD
MGAPITDRFVYQKLQEGRSQRARIAIIAALALSAILFQVYVPLFFRFLSYLELPLLVTLYFALMRRSPVAGTLIGCAIGLVQDSLAHHPLGMFGIVKTLVGYFAGSIGTRVAVEHPVMRFCLTFFFLVFHQFLYWVLARALLGELLGFDFAENLLLGFLNGLVGVSLFYVFDRLRVKG